MTIIFRIGSGFWIERHVANHGAIVTGTTSQVTINLDKPGRFVGACDFPSINSDSQNYTTNLIQIGGGAIGAGFHGTSISQLRSRFRNDSGGNLTMQHNVLVFLSN